MRTSTSGERRGGGVTVFVAWVAGAACVELGRTVLGAAQDTDDVVRARRIEVLDADGNVAIELYHDKDQDTGTIRSRGRDDGRDDEIVLNSRRIEAMRSTTPLFALLGKDVGAGIIVMNKQGMPAAMLDSDDAGGIALVVNGEGVGRQLSPEGVQLVTLKPR